MKMAATRIVLDEAVCSGEIPGAVAVAGVAVGLSVRKSLAAGSAIVTGNNDMVCLGFRHSGRDRAYTDLGNQLDRNRRLRVGVLQVVNELGQILDGVDVVVRRRADEAHARRGVPGLRDPRVHLRPRQLTALTGLGALGHLDLQFAGVDKVMTGDAEAAGRDLLDRGVL